jgi:hypothetical protein
MRTISFLSLSLLIAATSAAQGPDVIVGELNGMDSYGTDGSGIYAYSVGTTSCNIGNQVLNWIASTNQHPVIAQNIFRVKNGRFEQIGQSWLKHGFTALQQSLCSACTPNPGGGSGLGVGCSDPYGPGLNGSQSNGPKNEVNATTGYFPYPIAGTYPPGNTTVIGRRVQCQLADINPAQNVGATYFAEAQYVTADDAAAGNKHNNASHRKMSFGAAAPYTASFIGGTVQQQPAILGWQTLDPTVVISYYDDPQTGRFIIGKKVTNLGGGNFHYEFAVHNLNSDRSGRGFTVDFAPGTVVTNVGFHDIGYHSGEPWSGTDWTITNNGNSVNWATQLYIQNVNANALRWGTTYSFWCDANAASEVAKTIELFKPEPCLADPVVPSPTGYTLNTAAPYDNPTLPAPAAGPTGDDSSAFVPLGFSFTFYGTTYTSAYLSTNGFLTFNSAGATTFTNVCIPSTAAPSALIAAYWDDLITPPGSITYQTIGVAPNRRFVAHWNGVGLYGQTSNVQNFKIILDETTNVITTTIISSMAGGSSATRGIENASGSAGTQASCNTGGSAVAGTSQTYTPYATILPSADLVLTVNPSPGGFITWFVNSNGLGAPVILLAGTDPGPTSLGALGMLNIGVTPGTFVVIADGAGVLQPANPADTTDACGDWTFTLQLPSGLPPSLTIYNQGVVISPASIPPPPNGAFHITDEETITT